MFEIKIKKTMQYFPEILKHLVPVNSMHFKMNINVPECLEPSASLICPHLKLIRGHKPETGASTSKNKH